MSSGSWAVQRPEPLTRAVGEWVVAWAIQKQGAPLQYGVMGNRAVVGTKRIKMGAREYLRVIDHTPQGFLRGEVLHPTEGGLMPGHWYVLRADLCCIYPHDPS